MTEETDCLLKMGEVCPSGVVQGKVLRNSRERTRRPARAVRDLAA